MTRALFDAYSGVSGDMMLGALVAVGLDQDWLRALPGALGLTDVTVQIAPVMRTGIACTKVEFGIPPQPHGRHLKHIRALIDASAAPDSVKERAIAAFTDITAVEAEMHGTTMERVHLHEVGSVDAILDIVGSIWGLDLLGVTEVYFSQLRVGDGTVTAAHGLMPVPAPATLKLLAGQVIQAGPAGAGELLTPTGAVLVKTLSRGAFLDAYVPRASGYGAGTKEFAGWANALRLTLADRP